MNGNNITNFGRFGVERITKEIETFKENKIVLTNFYRTSIRFNKF